jgi:hypothetical protein
MSEFQSIIDSKGKNFIFILLKSPALPPNRGGKPIVSCDEHRKKKRKCPDNCVGRIKVGEEVTVSKETLFIAQEDARINQTSSNFEIVSEIAESIENKRVQKMDNHWGVEILPDHDKTFKDRKYLEKQLDIALQSKDCIFLTIV